MSLQPRITCQTGINPQASTPAADILTHQPRYMWLDPAAAKDPSQQSLWRNCVLADPQSTLFVRPEIALLPSPWGDSIIHAQPNGQGAFAAVAVLAPRIESMPAIPGLPLRMQLRGRRVVGNRLMGDQTESGQHAFVDSLVELLADGQADFVLFQDLSLESSLGAALAARGNTRHSRLVYPAAPQPHWYIRFPDKPDQYWMKFTKKSRYNFRWRAKKLIHNMVRITRPEQVADFLPKVNGLSEQAWQGRRLGLSIQTSDPEQQFWETAAGMGAMRCYLMEQDGRPIAYATGIQFNGCFIYDKTGYDPHFAQFSPGNVLLTRVIEDLIERDTPNLLDFGFGHAEYKEVFGNYSEMTRPVILARRALRPMLAVNLDRLCRGAGRTLRSALQATGILSTLRRLHRR